MSSSEASIDFDAFRQILNDKRTELEALLADSAEAAGVVELDQTKVGRLSRMDAMQRQAMSQATRIRRQQALKVTLAAMRRLDQGRFGDCLNCDEPIDPKRLQLDPAASHCISCAESAERKN